MVDFPRGPRERSASNWHSFVGSGGLCELPGCGLAEPAEIHHRSRVYPGATDDLTPDEQRKARELWSFFARRMAAESGILLLDPEKTFVAPRIEAAPELVHDDLTRSACITCGEPTWSTSRQDRAVEVGDLVGPLCHVCFAAGRRG